LSNLSKFSRISVIVITLFFLLILNARSGLIGFLLALCFIFDIRKIFIEKPVYVFFSMLLLIVIFMHISPDFQHISSFFESSNSRIYNIFSGN
ncbi:hypothetical protein OFC53_29885, partial [Escherichia coli]|nr:hypothetical protein [Escherichia coli]